VFEHGSPVNLAGHDVASYIKLRYSDDASIDRFSATVVGTNIIELSLTAKQTTCLPVTELVYSCEIRANTSPIAANNKIEKIIQGYLRILPEVTRNESFCTAFGFGPQPSATTTQASSSSSAKPFCCPEYWLKRTAYGSQYLFSVEVPTEQAVLNDVSYWEADFIINPGQTDNSISEVELIQNEINPTLVLGGYDMVYPIGGGRYRFISKMDFLTNGVLNSVFSVPVYQSLFNSAAIKIRYITRGGCITKWCNASMNHSVDEVFADCCPSPAPSASPSPSPSPTFNPNVP
jgi:hypothetical protein